MPRRKDQQPGLFDQPTDAPRPKRQPPTSRAATAPSIVPRSFEDEMEADYLDYGLSVIIARALPDVRDGLKPVHRRILWAMREMGNTPDKPFKKSARVVGEVLGKYHPHGDVAVYDAMVRMAQDWTLRYPLVQGHGNFGSPDGDSAAALRYTEVRLSPLGLRTLDGIDKGTVAFGRNFDDTLDEPLVLPSPFPNLLANGASGIAVGMSTNIPPHNLGEVVDAAIALIERPDLSDPELFRLVQGPDYPTGGEIIGRDGIHKAYLSGKGKLVLQGAAKVEEAKGGKANVVITSLPYGITKTRLIEAVIKYADSHKVPFDGIADVRDESGRDGMRLCIETKRGVDPEPIREALFGQTPLRTTVSVILLALVDGAPKLLTLRQMLTEYVSHHTTVVERRTRFDMEKAEKRLRIVEGLMKAVDMIDEVIRTIRASKSPDEAQQRLMVLLDVSEEQAKAILAIRLQQLTGLEITALRAEAKSLRSEIKLLASILKDKKKLLEVVAQDLQNVKTQFGDKRRTAIRGR